MALDNLEGTDQFDSIETKLDAAINLINALEPIGSVIPYFGTAAPNSKYLVCNGQAISRSTYSDLFTLLGTNYGAGNGSTTFNIPDLEGKFLVGYDSGDSDYNALTSAKTGGEKTHTLTTAEMPAHTHTYTRNANGTYNSVNADLQSGVQGSNGTIATSSTGGGDPHENRPPYLTVNYLIRVL
jgi:microcystin-dependent protein